MDSKLHSMDNINSTKYEEDRTETENFNIEETEEGLLEKTHKEKKTKGKPAKKGELKLKTSEKKEKNLREQL